MSNVSLRTPLHIYTHTPYASIRLRRARVISVTRNGRPQSHPSVWATAPTREWRRVRDRRGRGPRGGDWKEVAPHWRVTAPPPSVRCHSLPRAKHSAFSAAAVTVGLLSPLRHENTNKLAYFPPCLRAFVLFSFLNLWPLCPASFITSPVPPESAKDRHSHSLNATNQNRTSKSQMLTCRWRRKRATFRQYQSEIKKSVGAFTSSGEIYVILNHGGEKKKKLLFSLPINTLMHTCKYYANAMLIGGVAAKQPCCSNDWWENRWGQSQAVKAAPTQINKTLGD